VTRITPWLRRAGLVAAFVLAVAASPAAGQRTLLSEEERRYLDAHRDELTLWFNTDFPPIEFAGPDGRFTGLGADVIARVEERLGVVFRKQASSDWNAHLAALENGECLIAPTIVRTAERERYTLFTRPYAEAPVVLITERSFPGEATLDGLQGQRVVVVSGFATEGYVRERARGRFDVITAENVPEGLLDVSFGGADVLVENLAVAGWHIETKGVTHLRVAGTTDYAFHWSIGVSRRQPLLFSAIRKALDDIPEAELEAVRRRWMSLELPSGLDPETKRLLLLTALFALALVLGLAVVSWLLKRRLDEQVETLRTAQGELVAQSERLALAAEATRAGIWEYAPATGQAHYSSQWYAMLGYPAEPRVASLSDWARLVHPDDRPRSQEAFLGYLAQGGQEAFAAEFRMRDAEGSYRWVLCKGRVVERDAQGRPRRVVGLNVDVQAVKDVAEELRRSEELHRSLLSAIPDVVLRTSPTGEIVYVNDVDAPLLRAWGGREAILGRSIEELLVTEDDGARGAGAHPGLREYRAVGASGEAVVCEVNGDVLREADGRPEGMVHVIRDITARRRAQQALEESELRFRRLCELAPIPMACLALDGRVLDLNHRFVQVLGYTLADLAEPEGWWRLAYPDESYRDQVRAAWDVSMTQAFAGTSEFGPSDLRVTGKDGVTRPLQLTAGLIGDRILVGFFALTDRARAEEERELLQERLLQAQKMEAVGRLAGGVAHDFNNMLGVILGHAELARLGIPLDHALQRDLEAIQSAATRSVELTRQLLAFARKQTAAPRVLDLDETVGGLIRMLRRIIGEDIALEWRPGQGGWRVRLDPAQVDQILVNLCVNARDAAARQGRVVIETAPVVLDEAWCLEHPGSAPGEYVRLAVTDDGRGMDEATLARVFEPFFTTKELGRGTGLGLATVYGIVQQNGGFVDVQSTPGQGSTFAVHLPRCVASPEVDPVPPDATPPPARGETVLVVEDEPAILYVARTGLERLGYTVLTAPTPAQALAIATGGEPLDLLLTDVVMPEMNGRELADRLRTRHPGLRCLFMSGYTADVIAHQGVLEEGGHFLQKPFTTPALASSVRTALDSPVRDDDAPTSGPGGVPPAGATKP